MGRQIGNLSIEEKQARLVSFAQKQWGKPHRLGATISEAPRVFSCSSFIRYLYRRVGIKLPQWAIDQAKFGACVETRRVEDLEAGDLLFFTRTRGFYDAMYPQGIGHVAMYLGNGKIVHAPQVRNHAEDGEPDGSVQRASAARWLKRPDLVTIRRILA